MADRVIHAILTEYNGYGWGLTSPQIPTFVGGFDAPDGPLDEVIARELRLAGAPDEFMLEVHLQRVFEREDRQWLVRVKEDRLPSQANARQSAAGHLMELLSQTPEPIDEARRDRTGDPIFIVALESDLVGWVEDQLEDEDWVMIVVDTPGVELSIFPLNRVKELPEGYREMPRTMTIGEVAAGINFHVVEGKFTVAARESAMPVLI